MDTKKQKRKKDKRLFAYAEHLCAANRAATLGGWLAILHRHFFLVLHGPLCLAFNAIRFCCHDAQILAGVKEAFHYVSGTSQSMRVSSSSQLIVTRMGPRGDS